MGNFTGHRDFAHETAARRVAAALPESEKLQRHVLIHDLIVRLVDLARTAPTQRPQNLVALGGNDFTRRKTPRIPGPCRLDGDIGGNKFPGKMGDGRKDLAAGGVFA